MNDEWKLPHDESPGSIVPLRVSLWIRLNRPNRFFCRTLEIQPKTGLPLFKKSDGFREVVLGLNGDKNLFH